MTEIACRTPGCVRPATFIVERPPATDFDAAMARPYVKPTAPTHCGRHAGWIARADRAAKIERVTLPGEALLAGDTWPRRVGHILMWACCDSPHGALAVCRHADTGRES